MSDKTEPSEARKSSLPGCALLFSIFVAGVVILAIAAWFMTLRDPLVSKTQIDEIVITDVAVIDVVEGRSIPSRDVVIRDGVIESIVPAGQADRSGKVIDGSGKSIVPGLIDMHVHALGSPNPPWNPGLPDVELNLERFLFAGVTRVFDPGSPTPDIFELRTSIRNGDTLGPALHAAGPVFTAPDGHPVPMLRNALPDFLEDSMIDGMVRQVADPKAVRAAVDEVASHDPDFVKMAVDRIPEDAPRVDESVVHAFTAAAKSNDIRPVAHIGTTEDAILAGESGFSAWIHGVYKEPLADEDVERLAAFDIPMVATLVVFKSYAELGTSERSATDLEQQVADEELLASYETRPADYEADPKLAKLVENLRARRQAALDNVRKLHEAGVTILAGSDVQAGLLHGAALHRELDLLAEAGLSNLEVIRAATLYPARFLTENDDPGYGIVAEGKRADLVVVRGNPLDDLAAIHEVDEVILDGVLLQRDPVE